MDRINLAKFELDNLEELLKETQKIRGEIDGLKKANKELADSGQTLSKEYQLNTGRLKSLNSQYNANINVIANANTKTAELTKRQDALNFALKQEIKTIDDARANNKVLNKIRNATNVTTAEGREELRKINALLDRNNAFIKENSDAYAKQKQNIGNYTSAVDKARLGAKAFGAALKAAGIGLIVGAVVKLTDAFRRNQKVADFLATAANSVAIVFDKVVGIIVNTTEQVAKTTNGFDGLGKVVKGIIDIALTPMRATFTGIKGAILGVQLAWEKSPFGNKNQERIKELTEELDANRKELVKIGLEAVEAGKSIRDNFSDALDEVSDLGEAVVGNISNISLKGIVQEAAALTEYRKSIESLVARQEGLVQQYEREAEVLRQRRDDESLSVKDRIKANEQLGALLNKQEQAELKLVDIRVKGAQQELNANQGNAELEAELIRLRNERLEVENRIEGQRSEQLTNRNSLNEFEFKQIQEFEDKKKELLNAIDDANIIDEEQKELKRVEREFERQQLDLERLEINETQKTELLELLTTRREQSLQEVKDKFDAIALDKQAKVDAEQVKRKQRTNAAITKLQGQLIGVLQRLLGQGLAAQIAAIIAESAIDIVKIKTRTSAAKATNLANATATAPPPLNLPFIAMAATQNAALDVVATKNIASILGAAALKAVGSSISKFRDGGYVGGNLHSNGGTIIEAEKGEFVSSRKAVQKYGPLIAAMNESVGGKSGMNSSGFFKDGGLVARSITNSSRSGASLEDVRELIGEIKVVNVAQDTVDVANQDAIIVKNASV